MQPTLHFVQTGLPGGESTLEQGRLASQELQLCQDIDRGRRGWLVDPMREVPPADMQGTGGTLWLEPFGELLWPAWRRARRVLRRC